MMNNKLQLLTIIDDELLCCIKNDQYNQEILGLGWDFDYVMNISESDFPVR